VNPNSKIPALMDYSDQTPRRVFESGAILLYLADKFGAFLPKDRSKRTEALNWLFWQMGSTPYVGGGFGHFYAYAPVKIKYAIDRFAMEVKRQLDVLDRQLADNQFIAGDEYTIADMAIWPWYGSGMLNGASYNDPRKFLQTHEYKNLARWTKEIGERPASSVVEWSTVSAGRLRAIARAPRRQRFRDQDAGQDRRVTPPRFLIPVFLARAGSEVDIGAEWGTRTGTRVQGHSPTSICYDVAEGSERACEFQLAVTS
jgi:glutathione S-transferase